MNAKGRIIKGRFVLSQFTLGGFKFDEYFAEAKVHRRWRQVGGPFRERKEADDFARQYSSDHILDTRVVMQE
jgi:hypothetical protein